METVYQNPENLRLMVLEDPLVNGLKVLEVRELIRDEWKVRFAIIGESHWVMVQHHGVVLLQEILACTDLPDLHLLHEQGFSNREAYQYHMKRYQVKVWFEPYTKLMTHLGRDSPHCEVVFAKIIRTNRSVSSGEK